jgi:hypothetical protein
MCGWMDGWIKGWMDGWMYGIFGSSEWGFFAYD